MQEGWECHKCHNVYAPNVPFCLYCWFQQQNSTTSTIDSIILTEHDTETNINKKNNEIENQNIISNDLILPQAEINLNKQVETPNIDIIIPTLKKDPVYPVLNKWPDTKIYLSGIGHSKERAIKRTFKIPYILDSVMDFPIKPSSLVQKYFDYIKKSNSDFLLDSGAFTLMRNKHKQYDINDLISKYCFYINEFDIQNFFELDLDELMPIEDVENLRKKIYLETHKKPILVWHKERKREYWTRMCKENDFIAIGGMAHKNSEKVAVDIDLYQGMVDEAHTYNTKVHGLGFTPLEMLNAHTIFFDTVDSTTWNGNRRGISFILEDNKLKKIPLRNVFLSSDGIEEDLEAWANFSTNYYGATRL